MSFEANSINYWFIKYLFCIPFIWMQSIPPTIAQAQCVNWTQLGLDINGGNSGDYSGRSVSVSADGLRVAIGAPFNGKNGLRSGIAGVYAFEEGVWNQLGSDIEIDAVNSWLGRQVALSADGNTVVIGAPAYDIDGDGISNGLVRIYIFDGNDWTQFGSDIIGDSFFGGFFGYSLSIANDGRTVAIGAPWASTGQARIYNFDGSDWAQLGSAIIGDASQGRTGHGVSLSSSGRTVAIGGPNQPSIYRFEGSDWIRQGEVGSTDDYGFSVSLSANGNIVAIGSDITRIYSFDGTTWTQHGSDLPDGYSVSLSADGNTVAIGAIVNGDNGERRGHIRIYSFQGTDWVQQGIDIDGEATGDESGFSVSMSPDGRTVVIGGPKNDENGEDSGHTRIFRMVDQPTLTLESQNDFLCDGPTQTGDISLRFTNTPAGTYIVNYIDINNEAQNFDDVQVDEAGNAIITGLTAGTYNDLKITVGNCQSAEDVDVEISCFESVPTMSQWGLIIFALLMLNMALASIPKMQAVSSASVDKSAKVGFHMMLSPTQTINGTALILILTICSIFLFQGGFLWADLFGLPIMAFLIYRLLGKL